MNNDAGFTRIAFLDPLGEYALFEYADASGPIPVEVDVEEGEKVLIESIPDPSALDRLHRALHTIMSLHPIPNDLPDLVRDAMARCRDSHDGAVPPRVEDADVWGIDRHSVAMVETVEDHEEATE